MSVAVPAMRALDEVAAIPPITVTGGRFIENATYGIYVSGSSNVGPAFTVGGASLHSNGNFDLYTISFADAFQRTIDARSNWWGTTDTA